MNPIKIEARYFSAIRQARQYNRIATMLNKYLHTSSDGQNFIEYNKQTGECKCYTSGTIDPIQIVSDQSLITVFDSATVADIFNSDGELQNVE